MHAPDDEPLFGPDGIADEESAAAYIDFWTRRFIDSPEAREVSDAGADLGWAVGAMLQYGLLHLDKSVAAMTWADVEEILLGIFPEKVSCEPKDAPAIVSELAAFWRLVERELDNPHAAECIELLESPGLEEELWDELADPANYGIAKSFVMGGRAAGYDMTTKEGLEAYQRAYNEALDSQSDPAPGPRRSSKDADKARRRKRKAQKRSRRRNR